MSTRSSGPSPIRVEGERAYILLRNSGEEAVIDAADVPKVQGYNWQAARTFSQKAHQKPGRTNHVLTRVTGTEPRVTKAGKRFPGNRQEIIYLPRFLVGALPEQRVSYRDGNPLNCTRENLAVTTTLMGDWQPEPTIQTPDVVYAPWQAITIDGEQVLVSEQDLPAVLQYDDWIIGTPSPETPHIRYAVARGRGWAYSMHRMLMDAEPGMYVDHRNHNTLDNRRENLRVVTNLENNANRRGAYRTSKTGVRGVSTHRTKEGREYYVVRSHIQGKKTAKYFPHTEEGLAQARAYAEAFFKNIL